MKPDEKIAAPGQTPEGGTNSNEAKASTPISTAIPEKSRTILPETLAAEESGNRRLLATGFIQKSHLVIWIEIDGKPEIRLQCLNTGREHSIMAYRNGALICKECGKEFESDLIDVGIAGEAPDA